MKSNCCSAPILEPDICSQCLNHCGGSMTTEQLIEEAVKDFEQRYGVEKDSDLITTTNYSLKTFLKEKLRLIASKLGE